MTFDEAVKYLLGLGHETMAMKLGLRNVERLLAALGSPQSSYPAVQIAGTNGKGSTAAMLDSICRAASLRAGLYTSPHLVSVTERVRVAGRPIARGEFARLTDAVRSAALDLRAELGALPTFFEQVTAVALLAFREARVELAILETGLGGRLDATTAARAATIAVTPIALDHQEYLGTTLREIAAEKAAIIRPGVRAVVAAQEGVGGDALEVILARCRECGVAPRRADAIARDATTAGATPDGRLVVTFRTNEDVYENVMLALRGRHQLANAATAVALAEDLRGQGFAGITRAAVIAGLEGAEHAGRLELVVGRPALLFDGAHNAAGALALRAHLDEFIRQPLTLIFGAMRDKQLAKIASAIFPAAARLILTRVDSPRAAEPAALAGFAPRGFDPSRVRLADSAAEALSAAYDTTPPEGLICVTGSLYLIGEIKTLLASGL
jgi:dihydrofolate synthase/folylpolyglutamate synthase